MSAIPVSCKSFLTLLLALLLLTELCAGQEEVEDDALTWNLFFRNMRAAFPYPGTLNFHEWDDYKDGFETGIWDTQSFTSAIEIKADYTKNHSRYKLTTDIAWVNFWRFFSYYLNKHITPQQIEKQKIWESYINLMEEIYCCFDSNLMLGRVSFGCNDINNKIFCCLPAWRSWNAQCTSIGITVIKEWAVKSTRTLRFKFYVWLCQVFLHQKSITKHMIAKNVINIMSICPDPCQTQPCKELPNAKASISCRRSRMPERYYKNEFICLCKNGFQFDTHSKQCLPQLLCGRKGACNKTGLLECRDLERGGYECICKKGYTGSTCSAVQNPCLSRGLNEVTGNVACKSSEGNQCIPESGNNNFFTCECRQPFTRETKRHKLESYFAGYQIPPDNCHGQEDVCATGICNRFQHGRCMPSADKRNFTCVCNKDSLTGYPLYEGEFCEYTLSQWLEWSSWNKCRPECGESCYQLRQRQCKHKEGQVFCRGSGEELRSCEPTCRPCPNRSFIHLSGVFVKETGAPLVLSVASLFLMQIAVMAFAKWVVSRDALAL